MQCDKQPRGQSKHGIQLGTESKMVWGVYEYLKLYNTPLEIWAGKLYHRNISIQACQGCFKRRLANQIFGATHSHGSVPGPTPLFMKPIVFHHKIAKTLGMSSRVGVRTNHTGGNCGEEALKYRVMYQSPATGRNTHGYHV